MPTYTETAGSVTNQPRTNAEIAWGIGAPTSIATVNLPLIFPNEPYTTYLAFTDFGFSIPPTDTVLGVVVTYPAKGAPSGFDGADSSVVLWNSGASPDDRAQPASAYNTATPTNVSRGTSSDLWGYSAGALTPTQINASGFGFYLSCGPVSGSFESGSVALTVGNLPTITVYTSSAPTPPIGTILLSGSQSYPNVGGKYGGS
jgi:hypothetical protein